VLGYGRSIRPYGDSAFMEVLTAAANVGVLGAQEMQVAYSFIYKAACRFDTFWYDPSNRALSWTLKYADVN
jgi:hypothetical protein